MSKHFYPDAVQEAYDRYIETLTEEDLDAGSGDEYVDDEGYWRSLLAAVQQYDHTDYWYDLGGEG